MNIMKYRAFIKVVELGSYSAAARELGYSQPGLHHMITSLEQSLSSPLLINENNRIVPTEFGRSILNYAIQLCKCQDFIEEAMRARILYDSTLRIGSYNSLLLNLVPEILGDFSKEHPNATFYVQEYTYSECLTALSNSDVDLCFMANTFTEDFQFMPLLKDPVQIVMKKSHPFTAFDRIPISMLGSEEMIMYTPGSEDCVAAVMNQEPFIPNARFYVNTDSASLELIRSCDAFGMLSSLELTKISNDLTYRALELDTSRTLGIAYKKDRSASQPLLHYFLEDAKRISKDFCKRNGLLSLSND